MVIIPKILEYSKEQPKGIVYGLGLCFALFLTECLKSLSLCSCWVVNQRTGIRFYAAAFLLAFEKLIRFNSLTHITTGEVRGWGRVPGPCFPSSPDTTAPGPKGGSPASDPVHLPASLQRPAVKPAVAPFLYNSVLSTDWMQGLTSTNISIET